MPLPAKRFCCSCLNDGRVPGTAYCLNCHIHLADLGWDEPTDETVIIKP